MAQQLVDLSMLVQLSGNENKYIYEVLSIFIDSTTDTLQDLNRLTEAGTDFSSISSTAHSLKSGVGIVHIHNMLDELIAIEKLAKQKEDIKLIRTHVKKAIDIFESALPILLQEKEANKTSD